MFGGIFVSKTVAIIKNENQAKEIINLIDAYILPLENLSINYHNTFSLKQIEELTKLDKEMFVCVNKNIHNNELNKLEKNLIELSKLNIKGIIYYDIAVLNIVKKLNLNINLVWAQEHLTTNYKTVNYWYKNGANYTYLSSELTKREIDEIKNNTKAKLFVNIFGYIPMFTSRRNLIDNYINTFNLENQTKQNTIYKEGNSYPINDTNIGTTVYSNYILNATEEDFSNIDYLVFNSNLIDEKEFKNVLKNYKNKEKNKFPKETGFLYKETIYKVK